MLRTPPFTSTYIHTSWESGAGKQYVQVVQSSSSGGVTVRVVTDGLGSTIDIPAEFLEVVGTALMLAESNNRQREE